MNRSCNVKNLQSAAKSFDMVPECALKDMYWLIYDYPAIQIVYRLDFIEWDDEWELLPVPDSVENNKLEWKLNLLNVWINLMYSKKAIQLLHTDKVVRKFRCV
jgi:hypothetical protein